MTVNQAGLNFGTRGTFPLMPAYKGGHLTLFECEAFLPSWLRSIWSDFTET